MKAQSATPIVTAMQVIPVAGYDRMLLNLCGAHAPYFTRNIVILKDSLGNTGLGEVPGGICRRPLRGLLTAVVQHAQGAARWKLGHQRADRAPGLPELLHAGAQRCDRRIPHVRAMNVPAAPFCCDHGLKRMTPGCC